MATHECKLCKIKINSKNPAIRSIFCEDTLYSVSRRRLWMLVEEFTHPKPEEENRDETVSQILSELPRMMTWILETRGDGPPDYTKSLVPGSAEQKLIKQLICDHEYRLLPGKTNTV